MADSGIAVISNFSMTVLNVNTAKNTKDSGATTNFAKTCFFSAGSA
eukprot:CAMPEP_0169253070 /NCGR_PEP_ID=MMETSP1016-20121227/38401_1 /TAXON_ID=342587 /ORGANISM="Karlodinium micrum, Strain CCMP2283" /LENGTH=45 /DNA_ID= /DNA_START= /DNA_END= /DNA_ORIENTATION=